MDPLAFLTWQFILFSLGIMAVLLVIRRVVEYIFSKVKDSKFWNELVLTTAPIVIGGIMGFLFKAYPFATGFVTPGDHIIYGIVAGMLSGIIYKIVKGLLGNKIQSVVSNVASNMGLGGVVTPTVVTANPPQLQSNMNQLGAQVNSKPENK